MEGDFEKFIEMAIIEEQKAFELYTKIAGETKFESASALFTQLAKEEICHKELLQNLDLENLGSQRNESCAPMNLEDDLMMAPLSDFGVIKNVLDFAIKKEREAQAGYQKMADSLKQGEGKELFEKLVGEERNHERILTKQRENLLSLS